MFLSFTLWWPCFLMTLLEVLFGRKLYLKFGYCCCKNKLNIAVSKSDCSCPACDQWNRFFAHCAHHVLFLYISILRAATCQLTFLLLFSNDECWREGKARQEKRAGDGSQVQTGSVRIVHNNTLQGVTGVEKQVWSHFRYTTATCRRLPPSTGCGSVPIISGPIIFNFCLFDEKARSE